MPTTTGRVGALTFLLATMTAGGCATEYGKWAVNYDDFSRDMSGEDQERVPHREVVIEQAPYFETLAVHPQVEGLRIIGTTRFTHAGHLEQNGKDPDRTLRPHASRKGAELVRWAYRDAGPNTPSHLPDRVEYIAVYYVTDWPNVLQDNDPLARLEDNQPRPSSVANVEVQE